jgi:hypothetical protein
MKKITKGSFDKLRELYPVLSKNELIKVLGGTVSTDCVVRCFDFLDAHHSYDYYQERLCSSYGYDTTDHSVYTSHIVGFGNSGSLSVTELSASSFTLDSRGKIGGKEVMLTISGEGGEDHAVIATGIRQVNGQNRIICYDPTTQSQREISNFGDIHGVYLIARNSSNTNNSTGESSSSSGNNNNCSNSGTSGSSYNCSNSSTDSYDNYICSYYGTSGVSDSDIEIHVDFSNNDSSGNGSNDNNCCGNNDSSSDNNNYPYNCGN